MEPLTALSIAGTVVQFVDFGINLFCEGREIYASTRGTLTANDDVEQIINYLQKDVVSLRHSVWSTNPSFPLTEQDKELRRTLEAICGDVATVAEALLERLDNLKVKGTRGRKWGSFRKAVVGAWTKAEISSLKKQFASFREALETHVLLSIRTSVDSQAIRTSEHFETLERSSKRIISLLISTEEMIQSMRRSGEVIEDKTTQLINLVKFVDDKNRQQHEETQHMVAGGQASHTKGDIFCSLSEHIEEVMAMILDVSPVQQSMARKSAHRSVIRSLQYPMMSHRYEDVREAYPKTFNWVYEDSTTNQLPWNNFSQWLKTGQGVYWVSGKAGSGKSTLMKYLFDDPRTRQFLSSWTGDSNEGILCVATFFFWNSGTPEQQSQTGLLRALLFQIFTTHPDLSPLVLPDLWARSSANWMRGKPGELTEPWPIKALLGPLRTLLRQKSIPLNLFFLIDGLDEFDGEPEKIAELLLEIGTVSDSHNVKVCLSSRPWVVFEDLFRQCPQLRLQDLTQGDIDHYVHDSFRRNGAFQELEIREPESAPRLLHDVVEKADGVFLWVRIVVKSLLDGIRNRDDMTILHQRLDDLPPELEPLYEHLLSRIEPIYMRWASKVFQILRVCRELYFNPFNNPRLDGGDQQGVMPLTISKLLLAIEDNLHITSMKGTTHVLLDFRYEDLVVQLTARCAGFIEVPQFSKSLPSVFMSGAYDSLVQYLHRTVRDFLEKKRRWSILLMHTAETNFNPYLCMMKSEMLYLSLRFNKKPNIHEKLPLAHEPIFYFDDFNGFGDPADEINRVTRAASKSCMILAFYANKHTETHDGQEAIIDNLDLLLTKKIVFLEQHWSYRLINRQHFFSDMSLLELAAFHGLSGYISKKLEQLDRLASSKKASCLLAAILRVRDCNPRSLTPPLRPEIVASLLQHGADPNELFGTANEVHSTPWGSTLYFVWRAATQFSHRLEPAYIQIMNLLVRHGASPRTLMHIPMENRQLSAIEVITNYLSPRFPLEAAELLRELEHNTAVPTARKRWRSESEEDQLFSSRRQKIVRIS